MVPTPENSFRFEMPDTNLARFKALMLKITRKCERLGFKAIPYHTTGHHFEKGRGKIWEMVIETPSVKVEGWRFVAVIDHTHETGNVIRSIPNEEIPDKFRTAEPVCEHCGIRRYRRDTFVLRADNGEDYKQVGKTCLVDFLGYDPGKLAQLAEQIGRMREDVLGLGGGGTYVAMFDLETYLEYVAMCIRRFGFVSRKFAYENPDRSATADVARGMMIYGTDAEEIIAVDTQNVREALAWAHAFSEKPEKSDYEHNVSVIAGSSMIEPRSAGIAASIVGVYMRNLAKAASPAPAIKLESNYLGTEGENITVDVTVTLRKSLENSVLMKFVDVKGNVLTWFATGKNLPALGATVKLTGTVKKHDNFGGVKGTIVNRCTFKPLDNGVAA